MRKIDKNDFLGQKGDYKREDLGRICQRIDARKRELMGGDERDGEVCGENRE